LEIVRVNPCDLSGDLCIGSRAGRRAFYLQSAVRKLKFCKFAHVRPGGCIEFIKTTFKDDALVQVPAEARCASETCPNGGNITVIIDGAEHEIYSSTDKQLSYVTFSGKKSYHTLTKLIAVSPTGEILFISKSFPGGMNDLNLIQMPEILNAIQVSDDEFILADRGFRGMEDYRILTPYTETNASRFTTYDKKFKAIRVKVENGILQVRRWRICHTLFRVKPMDIRAAMRKHHQIWLICAALVNFVNHGRRP
jgi:hypothetical protein